MVKGKRLVDLLDKEEEMSSRFSFRWMLRVSAVGAIMGACVAAGTSSASGDQAPLAVFSKTRGAAEYRVALLTPGTRNDQNWGQALTEGMNAGSRAYGAKIRISDGLNTPDPYFQQAAAFASQGYNLVIIGNSIAITRVQRLAAQFPKTDFCIIFNDAKLLRSLPPNACFWDVAQQEPAFLAGVVAGLVTKTGVIGAVSPFAFPGLTRQPEAYGLGARCVNPKVKFVQKYINSYTDTALAKAATEAMMSQGADVFLATTAGAEPGIYQAAREKAGTWIIPGYYDAHRRAPDVILTSVLYDLQGAMKTLVGAGAQGKLRPREFFNFGLRNRLNAGLAPFYSHAKIVGAANLAKLAEIKQKIVEGKIRVPGGYALGKVGSGLKVNPKSIGC